MAEEQKKVYTCPMHPDVRQEKPGTCPVCQMALVRKDAEGREQSCSCC